MTAAAVQSRATVEWTPELVDTLREMRAAKMTAGEIADRLGTTKNAVIGAAKRYKLERIGNHGLNDIKWTPELIERARSMWSANAKVRDIAAAIGCTMPAIWGAARRYFAPRQVPQGRPPGPSGIRVKVVPVVDTEIPISQRCSILELSEHTCRWPVGDPGTPEFFYCGAEPIQGRSYCAAHHARAHGYVREKR